MRALYTLVLSLTHSAYEQVVTVVTFSVCLSETDFEEGAVFRVETYISTI